MMRLVPILEMFFRTLSLEPCPIDIMIITAATPMMIPNMDKKERNLLLQIALRAIFIKLNRFIWLFSLDSVSAFYSSVGSGILSKASWAESILLLISSLRMSPSRSIMFLLLYWAMSGL